MHKCLQPLEGTILQENISDTEVAVVGEQANQEIANTADVCA